MPRWEIESKVDTASLDVGDLRVKPTLTGTRLFEISGQGGCSCKEFRRGSARERDSGHSARPARGGACGWTG